MEAIEFVGCGMIMVSGAIVLVFLLSKINDLFPAFDVTQTPSGFFSFLTERIGIPATDSSSNDSRVIEYCQGTFKNRPLRLNYLFNKEQPEQSEILEIRIPVQQKFWLRMNRQRLQEEDADEIQTGHRWLDREYVIHTNHKEAAESFLKRYSVWQHFSKFPCTFDKLEIVNGELVVILNDPRLWKMRASHLESLLNRLHLIATDYEDNRFITMQISSPQGKSRCPYCRNPFDEVSGTAIQCSACSTRLHESCWTENQQCTTWGCRSTLTVSNMELERNQITGGY
jgi:hypothetical protein